MVTVLHVPALKDNYIWIIVDESTRNVAIVDPGDAAPVIKTLTQQQLRPTAILCTHHHGDHVGGVSELLKRYDVPVYGPAHEDISTITHPLTDGDRIDVPGLRVSFEVLATPGHTRGHIAYYGNGMLFCGDTLFSAGCGRLFEGTAAQLLRSLLRFASLPDDTRVFCAHEYTESNLRFASTVEPTNRDMRDHAERVHQLRLENRPSLPSTIGLEKRINPFLRSSQRSVKEAVQAHAKQQLDTEVEIFATLRRWKDGFTG